ncbi:uncharacterized protein LOC114277452 [Camellia sinensis]|uniref:uncharacterized protein LOC114277452 n=1 Tax=Camellia sinensis TaxID=4442 RepID=UPI001036D1C6|nr:uncharacterized protein LOC114277452 [Camellia sinensis]
MGCLHLPLEKRGLEIDAYALDVLESNWRHLIVQDLSSQDVKASRAVKVSSINYILYYNNLYKVEAYGLLLDCLGLKEARTKLAKVHEGIYGAHQFNVPQTIIVDNGIAFEGGLVRTFSGKFGISIIKSTPYYTQANGQAKSSNKTIKKGIQKMT